MLETIPTFSGRKLKYIPSCLVSVQFEAARPYPTLPWLVLDTLKALNFSWPLCVYIYLSLSIYHHLSVIYLFIVIYSVSLTDFIRFLHFSHRSPSSQVKQLLHSAGIAGHWWPSARRPRRPNLRRRRIRRPSGCPWGLKDAGSWVLLLMCFIFSYKQVIVYIYIYICILYIYMCVCVYINLCRIFFYSF